MMPGVPDDLTVSQEQAKALRLDDIVAAAQRPVIHEYSALLVEARDKAQAAGRGSDALAIQLGML